MHFSGPKKGAFKKRCHHPPSTQKRLAETLHDITTCDRSAPRCQGGKDVCWTQSHNMGFLEIQQLSCWDYGILWISIKLWDWLKLLLKFVGTCKVVHKCANSIATFCQLDSVLSCNFSLSFLPSWSVKMIWETSFLPELPYSAARGCR